MLLLLDNIRLQIAISLILSKTLDIFQKQTKKTQSVSELGSWKNDLGSSRQAYCDMRSGTTRLEHGMGGGEHRVSSCSEAGCSVHRVAYDAPMKQMAALMALSAQCEQHVKVGTGGGACPGL